MEVGAGGAPGTTCAEGLVKGTAEPHTGKDSQSLGPVHSSSPTKALKLQGVFAPFQPLQGSQRGLPWLLRLSSVSPATWLETESALPCSPSHTLPFSPITFQSPLYPLPASPPQLQVGSARLGKQEPILLLGRSSEGATQVFLSTPAIVDSHQAWGGEQGLETAASKSLPGLEHPHSGSPGRSLRWTNSLKHLWMDPAPASRSRCP